MKVLIDTCVLYPTVMRQLLLGAAGSGLFTPLWSDRILEEWARAARKIGPTGEVQARHQRHFDDAQPFLGSLRAKHQRIGDSAEQHRRARGNAAP